MGILGKVLFVGNLFLFVCLYSTEGAVYTISSNGCNNCISFTYFLENTSILSNSTIYFYPGVYRVHEGKAYSIVNAGLQNVTIKTLEQLNDGQDDGIATKAQMYCTNQFKLAWLFIDCKDIHVENLEMINCGVPLDSFVSFIDGSFLATIESLVSTDTLVTLVLARGSNFTLSNVRLSDTQGLILFVFDVGISFQVSRSTLNGAVSIYTRQQEFELEMHESQFLPRLSTGSEGDLYLEGVTINTQADMSLTIQNSTFQGYDEIYCNSLSIMYGICSSLTLRVISVLFKYGGVSVIEPIGDSQRSCVRPKQILIYNCSFINIYSRTGVEVSGIARQQMVKYKYTNVVDLALSNSKFIGCKQGFKLRELSAELSGNLFENNSAKCENCTIIFYDANKFIQNRERRYSFGTILFTELCRVYIKGYLLITNNLGNKYSAVIVKRSSLFISGKVNFINNVGFYGGALSLYSGSTITLSPQSRVVFIDNHAFKSGGAIYVETESYVGDNLDITCFYDCMSRSCPNPVIFFCNNTSLQGGYSVYGGSVDDCLKRSKDRISLFDRMVNFCDEDESTSLVSSKPIRLCFCNDSGLICDVLLVNLTIIPGQTFELTVMAVGQQYGTISATIQAKLELKEELLAHIEHSQRRQLVFRTCSVVRYTIYGIYGTHVLYVSIRELSDVDIWDNLEYGRSGTSQEKLGEYSPEVPLTIQIHLQPCPLGFNFEQESLSCVCLPFLVEASIHCNINRQTVIKPTDLWINVTNTTAIIHRHCPIGYCKTAGIEFLLNDPSTQCLLNRDGTLCGKCEGNMSQVLGSFSCRTCSDFWLLLIVPVVVLCGILLVIFLMVSNLTVATGTINGLIFYANIVQANKAIYFSSQTKISTQICSVFISWLNLDLGFEVCLYNGLDAFVKTILQLVFPLYICALVIVIILSSHYSIRAARLSGNNSVQVLATLFLLSYSKSIRLVITALSVTRLTIHDYVNGFNTTKFVWLYDGNVDYLQGKHVIIFLIGVFILIVVSLPFTTLLFFVQCLQKISHLKYCMWVWKMQPLFDAYTGPYKSKFRYWTGLLLLIRVVLYTVYTMNIDGDPSINLLATVIAIQLLLVHLITVGKVYKSKLLGILELSFLLNVIVLSVSSLFAVHINKDQEIVTNISVFLAIVTFGGIMVGHAVVSLKSSKKLTNTFNNKRTRKDVIENVSDMQQNRELRPITLQVVSLDDLQDPLLEN